MLLPEIVHKAYLSPFTVQSNFARKYATEIAMLASGGYLTTEERRDTFGKTWRVTSLGLAFLKNENTL
jgi:hypothetical protein